MSEDEQAAIVKMKIKHERGKLTSAGLWLEISTIVERGSISGFDQCQLFWHSMSEHAQLDLIRRCPYFDPGDDIWRVYGSETTKQAMRELNHIMLEERAAELAATRDLWYSMFLGSTVVSIFVVPIYSWFFGPWGYVLIMIATDIVYALMWQRAASNLSKLCRRPRIDNIYISVAKIGEAELKSFTGPKYSKPWAAIEHWRRRSSALSVDKLWKGLKNPLARITLSEDEWRQLVWDVISKGREADDLSVDSYLRVRSSEKDTATSEVLYA